MVRRISTQSGSDVVSLFAAMQPHSRASWPDGEPPDLVAKLNKLRDAFYGGKLPAFRGKVQTLARMIVRTFNLQVSVDTVARWIERGNPEDGGAGRK